MLAFSDDSLHNSQPFYMSSKWFPKAQTLPVGNLYRDMKPCVQIEKQREKKLLGQLPCRNIFEEPNL
jgi:hypothetical protein